MRSPRLTMTAVLALSTLGLAVPGDGQEIPPVSGLIRVGSETYLMVHDTKAHKEGPRIAFLDVHDRDLEYVPAFVPRWGKKTRSSDLESACPLSGRPGEFLVAESGAFTNDDGETRLGQAYHLRFAGPFGEVVATLPLPLGQATVRGGPVGDNYEGLACLALADGDYLVVLAERGGSATYPHGELVSTRWRPGTVWPGDRGAWNVLTIATPDDWWIDLPTRRELSDLYLDPEGDLWAVGGEEIYEDAANEDGALVLRSVVYRLGGLRDGDPPTLRVLGADEMRAEVVLEGVRAEGLAAAPVGVTKALFAVGLEDEDYGGGWRLLPIRN